MRNENGSFNCSGAETVEGSIHRKFVFFFSTSACLICLKIENSQPKHVTTLFL